LILTLNYLALPSLTWYYLVLPSLTWYFLALLVAARGPALGGDEEDGREEVPGALPHKLHGDTQEVPRHGTYSEVPVFSLVCRVADRIHVYVNPDPGLDFFRVAFRKVPVHEMKVKKIPDRGPDPGTPKMWMKCRSGSATPLMVLTVQRT